MLVLILLAYTCKVLLRTGYTSALIRVYSIDLHRRPNTIPNFILWFYLPINFVIHFCTFCEVNSNFILAANCIIFAYLLDSALWPQLPLNAGIYFSRPRQHFLFISLASWSSSQFCPPPPFLLRLPNFIPEIVMGLRPSHSSLIHMHSRDL